ncbi:MAG: hypothetical protein QG657_4323, partial [Acidobacteriota bacterium]|nr:hypothetical protein [Acidobacteriota bacterium]
LHHSSFMNTPNHFIRAFDLSKAPLLRMGLIEIEKDRHIFLIDMHHIISDGMSIGILAGELSALLAGLGLPAISFRYKDYAAWQYGEKKSKNLREQEEYWLKEFADEIPVLDLPTDFSRPALQSFAGDYLNFELGRQITDSIKALSLDAGATLYMVLLVLYTIFLAKISSREDIVIGTPVAGRRHADFEKIIGMFVNTLALRNYPAGEKEFADFLGEVKERTLKAFENQDYQYEDLVEELAITRDAGRNPLFDALLVLQNAGRGVIEIPGLKIKPYELENLTAKFDLSLMVMETEDKLLLTFEYSTKLFKKETVGRFISYFENIVKGVIKNKEQKISDYEITAEDEKKRILFDFNDTAAEYPVNKTIHRLFEEQVEQNPDRIALVGATAVETLRATSLQISPTYLQTTYRQLNEQSDRLAGLLIERGVRTDNIVGIMMERCIEMILGIWGILKAGGAYLPIDPDYPQERIDYILKDSAAKILLTATQCVFNFHHSSFIIHHSIHSTSNLAYVIYTSGSTGKPKGVLIQHGSVVNRLNWMQQMYPLGSNDTILQKTPFTFDVSVWELFWWSFYGARLCLLEPGEEKDPAAIIKSIDRNHITTMHFVPSMLNAFLAYLESLRESYRCVSLRQVFASGEALGASHVEQFYRLLKVNGNCRVRLSNLYGPTEATVDVSYYNCSADRRLDAVTAPIGKPIHNTHLYVVNVDMGLQPIGIAGELCIAGVGLARGYLNRPQLTCEKFIKYRTNRTNINYKTGDLARWLPDGNIEFLGRIDYQVKIRGFRIELGEIENELARHKAIKECVVLEKEGKWGDKYLCAYFVAMEKDDNDIMPGELRDYLSGKLPHYMVPAYFIRLEKMPLTGSGKVDRKTLQGISGAVTSHEEYAEPVTHIEKKLVDAWKEALNIEKVGIKDRFFSIGGDSLRVIRLISSVNKRLEVNLEIIDLYRNETIEMLAKRIEEVRDFSLNDELAKMYEELEAFKERILSESPSLHTKNVEDLYPMSEIEKGMVLDYLKYSEAAVYHDQFVVQFNYEDFNPDRFDNALKLLVEKHSILRTSFNIADFDEFI